MKGKYKFTLAWLIFTGLFFTLAAMVKLPVLFVFSLFVVVLVGFLFVMDRFFKFLPSQSRI
jgi:hypothetical protein